MSPATFLVTFILALSVTATPVPTILSSHTLPISRRLNLTNVHNLARHDQTRAKHLKVRGTARATGLHVRGDPIIGAEEVENQGIAYVASVNIGSPPTSYNLIVDTGSSNTWVGAGKGYVQTSTSFETDTHVYVPYGSGAFYGMEYIDQVSVASALVVQNQSIGVASASVGFSGFDGILGIGPVDLTLQSLNSYPNNLVPTVTDNLFGTGTISEHSIAVSFEPITIDDEMNGEITWGGANSSKYIGNLSLLPITTTSPASQYWGIDQSISYGGTTILSSTAGIVDTGTTLVLIASDAYAAYTTATGAVLDKTTGLLLITKTQFSNVKSLFFRTPSGSTFELTANAQIWPLALNSVIGGTSGNVYLIVGNLGTPSGEGFDFILGLAFLERFYAVFDTGSQTVGLANTTFTYATTN
ncbi:hypothetical protein HYPSUDRAFT_147208 [Hypholoma sublateritium FD-334 SS-4]|uniref:Peptidase A1 domain-containing protein n=1 Tax=Hypholoma sublateritium (strain FD-334 SS-4) TaxID=945553 RepID=A0A0D2NJT1_HYPSF|nr:hypothetical protein HYPSUDRAFT_147208 [Hypholoma sublateritium FD-334 SS-4]